MNRTATITFLAAALIFACGAEEEVETPTPEDTISDTETNSIAEDTAASGGDTDGELADTSGDLGDSEDDANSSDGPEDAVVSDAEISDAADALDSEAGDSARDEAETTFEPDPCTEDIYVEPPGALCDCPERYYDVVHEGCVYWCGCRGTPRHWSCTTPDPCPGSEFPPDVLDTGE
jgi:hypothetical protein